GELVGRVLARVVDSGGRGGCRLVRMLAQPARGRAVETRLLLGRGPGRATIPPSPRVDHPPPHSAHGHAAPPRLAPPAPPAPPHRRCRATATHDCRSPRVRTPGPPRLPPEAAPRANTRPTSSPRFNASAKRNSSSGAASADRPGVAASRAPSREGKEQPSSA